MFSSNNEELLRLIADIDRRFKKRGLSELSYWGRLKYVSQNPQYIVLYSYRLSKAFRGRMLFGRLFAKIYTSKSVLTGVEVLCTNMGGGVIIPHFGTIKLNAEKIGENLYVFHGVTIGNDYVTGRPTIGNNVFIGANSNILGAISIGDNVVIGAGTTVTRDIPSNTLVKAHGELQLKEIGPEYIKKMVGY